MRFKKKAYTVTFSVVGGTGGTLKAKPEYGSESTTNTTGTVSVEHGKTVAFTAEPYAGYEVDSWSSNVGNISSDKTKATLSNVTGNGITVTVRFKKKTYTVRFSVANGKGKLQGSYDSQNPTTQNGSGEATLTNVPHGTSVTFTAKPDDGWELDSWTGVSSSALTASLTVDGPNKTVRVKFKPGVFDLAGGPNAWKRLKEEVEKTEGAHTITISGEITATNDQGNNGKISIRRDLIIKSSGPSASLNASNLSGIFNVDKKLTLENIKLKNGKEPGDRTGAGAYVNNSTLIMKGSSAITNCSAHKGGGVYVNNGTLIMQDSSAISSCTATDKGSGVYVAGTFEMKDNAKVDTNNDVYLESGKSITVTGALTNEPAAKIRLADYQKNRALAVGEHAKKENFQLAPDGGNNWRYKKVGNEVKFVTGKLTYTIEKIISIEEHDGSTWAEYYWTMKIDGKNVSRKKHGQSWKPETPSDKKKPRPEYTINESRTVLFNYTDKKTVGAYFLIKEEDHGTGGDDTVADVTKNITYENDQLEFEGKTISLDQEESVRLEFHGSGEGDVDVVCRIRWEDE